MLDLPEAVDNTAVIARRCAVMPRKVKPILPPFDTHGGHSEEELKAQAREGLDNRIKAGATCATPAAYSRAAGIRAECHHPDGLSRLLPDYL